jgi:hypothetical protein
MMIADLDETLRQLLVSEMPIKNGEIEVSFHQPKREWSTRLTKPTVNLYLYDLRENPTLRAPQWERLPDREGNGKNASQKRSPMRIDCFYMLTTWAAEPDDEHRLLTRSLMTLFRFPLLPKESLIGSLQNQEFDIPVKLANHDRLTNPAELWGSLDNEVRPSVSLLVTLALDPWEEISGPIVRTLILRSGQRRELPGRPQLHEDTLSEMVDIGGTVWLDGKTGQPATGVDIAIKGTGLFTKTDHQGRFILGSLPPGEYTLVAWSSKGKPRQKNIQISAQGSQEDHDYDLEL